MATKRKILQQLVRDELQWIAQTHELAVEDWRRLDALIDAIHVLAKAALREGLLGLSRDRLKQICRHLELDDRGNRAVLRAITYSSNMVCSWVRSVASAPSSCTIANTSRRSLLT